MFLPRGSRRSPAERRGLPRARVHREPERTRRPRSAAVRRWALLPGGGNRRCRRYRPAGDRDEPPPAGNCRFR